MPLTGAEPVRRFAWRPRQRHRPGLQFLVSTGRHHGFESLEEQRLLLVLDFGTFTGPAGQFGQRTALSSAQRRLLAALDLPRIDAG